MNMEKKLSKLIFPNLFFELSFRNFFFSYYMAKSFLDKKFFIIKWSKIFLDYSSSSNENIKGFKKF